MHRIFFDPKTFTKDDENEGAAWIAGNACCPMLEDSVKPKMARAWTWQSDINSYSIDSNTLLNTNNIPVHFTDITHIAEDEGLLRLKPHAIISFAFSRPMWMHSSRSNFFHRYFSSSVNWITRGQSNVSWSHFVKKNGIKWPRWRLPDEGPLRVTIFIFLYRPVYK